jgi:hypothetical protein
MDVAEPSFDHSTFSRNRARLLAHDVAREFFTRVVAHARRLQLLSDEHFRWLPPTTFSESPDSARPPHEARLHHTPALASASENCRAQRLNPALSITTMAIKLTNQTPSSTACYEA